MTHVGAAFFGANERAVVDDHGERGIDFLRNGKGEVVTAAGDQRDFDAAAGSFGDGGAIGFGDLPAAVEQRAVNIQGDEADRHVSIIAWNLAVFVMAERLAVA